MRIQRCVYANGCNGFGAAVATEQTNSSNPPYIRTYSVRVHYDPRPSTVNPAPPYNSSCIPIHPICNQLRPPHAPPLSSSQSGRRPPPFLNEDINIITMSIGFFHLSTSFQPPPSLLLFSLSPPSPNRRAFASVLTPLLRLAPILLFGPPPPT